MAAATFEIYRDSFAKILGRYPNLLPVATGFSYLEGPVYMKAPAEIAGRAVGYLFIVDWAKDSVQVIVDLAPYAFAQPAVFRSPAEFPAGQCATGDGMLLTCGSTDHQVSITRPNGDTVSLVNEFEGKPLNSPNDICVKSDGTIWFTDPAYSAKEFLRFPTPALPNAVYRYDPETGSLDQVARHDPKYPGWECLFDEDCRLDVDDPDDFGLIAPNGLCFSPDEKTLYIADSGAEEAMNTYFTMLPHRVWKCDVHDDGTLSEPRKFFVTPEERPDGLRCDVHGNLYVAVHSGVRVVNPEGVEIGLIRTPANTGNLTFGGPDNDILFTTSQDTIWAIKLNTRGAVPLRTVGFDVVGRLPDFFHDSRIPA